MPFGLGSILGNAAAGRANANASQAAHTASQLAALAAVNTSAGSVVHPLQLGSHYATSGVPFGMGISGFPSNIAPQVEPLVFATQTALMQPKDKKWRRFQHALFRIDDVAGVYAEGSGSFNLWLSNNGHTMNHTFTLPFECDDAVAWFASHVLNMEFPDNTPTT